MRVSPDSSKIQAKSASLPDYRTKKRRPSSLEHVEKALAWTASQDNVEKALAWAAQRQCPHINAAIAEYEKDFPTRKLVRHSRSSGYVWENCVPPKKKRRAPGVTASAAQALSCSRQTLHRLIALKGERAVAILLAHKGRPDLAKNWDGGAQ